VLFGADSDPAITAPRGKNGEWPAIIRADNLATLEVNDVAARAHAIIAR
jgi:hypothetical protein